MTKNFDSSARKDYSGSSWDVGVRWSPLTYSVFDFVTSKQTNESTGVGDAIVSNNYGVTWSHAWSSRLRTQALASYRNDDFLESSAPRAWTTPRTFGAKVAYDFRRWLRLGAEYTHTDRNSNLTTSTTTSATCCSAHGRRDAVDAGRASAGAASAGVLAILSSPYSRGCRMRFLAALAAVPLSPCRRRSPSCWRLPRRRSRRSDAISNYRLGSGDVISIQVLGEEDLKREKIRLSDAATISYPILGEIKLFGKTVAELEALIRDGLKGRYLVNPQVTVTIIEYRNFFINGQVEKPGGYPYIPGLTVRKAVSLAGGFKERASKEKIFVIRDDDRSQTPKRVDQNAAVNPGDIITVEESFF